MHTSTAVPTLSLNIFSTFSPSQSRVSFPLTFSTKSPTCTPAMAAAEPACTWATMGGAFPLSLNPYDPEGPAVRVNDLEDMEEGGRGRGDEDGEYERYRLRLV